MLGCLFARPSRKGAGREKMSKNANGEGIEFMIGCVIPKELNDRVQAKCKEAGTTLYDAILAFIKGLADGEITINKRS